MRALFVVIAFIATPAWSLSCLRPDGALMYQQAQSRDGHSLIVIGQLDHVPSPAMNHGPPNNSPTDVRFQTIFSGNILTNGKRGAVIKERIEVEQACVGPWCGQAIAGVDLLAIVDVTGHGLALKIDPCYSAAVFHPAHQLIETLKACQRGEPCRQN